MITIEELLEDAYKNYYYDKNTFGPLTIAQFIEEIKTDSEFAKTWGVDVSVRELSLEERVEIARKTLSKEEFYKYGLISPFTTIMINYWLNQHNISTKVITITYNNKTIEVYEQRV